MERQISKRVLQDTVYLRGTNEAVISVLKSYDIKYLYNKIELEEALLKALDIFKKEDEWAEIYANFVQGTIYERGEIYEDKYGKDRLYPLPFWTKWKLKKNGEYFELPSSYPLYWLFLIVPVINNYRDSQLFEYKRIILEELNML
jgi:hypothetical protein